MQHRADNQSPAPYAVRTKIIGKHEHRQIYVPSRLVDGVQEYAWIELVDPPTSDGVLDLLYDPTYIDEWKIIYLHAAYREYREVENARKRQDLFYSEWEVEVHDGPQDLTLSVHEDQVNGDVVVDRLLSHLSVQQAHYIRLHVFDRQPFVEIVRDELPQADETDVQRRANTIGRSVKRALAQLKNLIENECPDLVPPTDV